MFRWTVTAIIVLYTVSQKTYECNTTLSIAVVIAHNFTMQ